MRGLVSGSFDPITLGHMEMIDRASKVCEELYVVVFNNEDKDYMFDLIERVRLVRVALSGVANIVVSSSTGMVVDYCKEQGIDKIIRGFRDSEDYAYESKMAEYNYTNSGVDTYILPAIDESQQVSSTNARERIQSGEDLTDILAETVIEEIRRIEHE